MLKGFLRLDVDGRGSILSRLKRDNYPNGAPQSFEDAYELAWREAGYRDGDVAVVRVGKYLTYPYRLKLPLVPARVLRSMFPKDARLGFLDDFIAECEKDGR